MRAEARDDDRGFRAIREAQPQKLRRARPCGAVLAGRNKIGARSDIAVEDKAEEARSVQKGHSADGIEAAPMKDTARLARNAAVSLPSLPKGSFRTPNWWTSGTVCGSRAEERIARSSGIDGDTVAG